RLLFILSTLAIFIYGTVSHAEEYSVLVVPAGLVGINHNSSIGNTNIEEILARKLIKAFEYSKTACAPSMSTLKISIMNNSNFIPKAVNPINNTKIISKSYGVSKVVLISSKIEFQNALQQKSFWNRMEMPVLTPPEANIRIVTTVTMLNTASDDVIWCNVFYKNINCIGNGINNYNTTETKLSAINMYYDELTSKIIEELSYTKETSAIMLTSKVPVEKDKAKPVAVIKPSKLSKQPAQAAADKPPKYKTIKPNLEMHENIQAKKNESIFSKTVNKIQSKYNSIVQSYENNRIKKAEAVSKPKPELPQKTISAQKSPKITKEKSSTIKIKQTKKRETKVVQDKVQKPPLRDRIILKFEELKQTYLIGNRQNGTDENNNADYINIMGTDNMDNMPVQSLQTKPRTNSRNYIPKFDESINDM
ncbi:MAG: hypothetical protein LUB59_05085, partial [Candidatus Gastranaerophilales bacterium]|nr:hypothetical protein [Candidatus Gastranaerophilales bacterium]